MALPSFSDVLKDPGFATLDADGKQKVADGYWREVGAENPAASAYAEEQLKNSKDLLKLRTERETADPVTRRVLDHQDLTLSTRLALGDAEHNKSFRDPAERDEVYKGVSERLETSRKTVEELLSAHDANLGEGRKREAVAGFIGGGSAKSLAGFTEGNYQGAKDSLNDWADLSDGVAEALLAGDGDIDKAINWTRKRSAAEARAYDDSASTSARTGAGSMLGLSMSAVGASRKYGDPAVVRLEELKSSLDTAGVPAADRSRVIKDAAMSTAWTANTADRTRKLSTGELAINPGRVFGDKEGLLAEIRKSDTSAGNKELAAIKLDQMRERMAGKLFTSAYYSDTGNSDSNSFRAFSKAKFDAGQTDKAQILDEWSAKQKDRNWLFSKAPDAIWEGIRTGEAGIAKTVIGTAAGVASLWGGGQGLAQVQADLGSAIERSGAAADLRGLDESGLGVTKDLANTITQMAPMFAGAGLAGGATTLGAAVTRGASVYGWAAAQGYESKLADAVRLEGQKLGRDLTGDEMAEVLGRGDTQLAAFANGAQTAILAKVLGGGVERAALGRAAESMTVKSFLQGGGAAAIRDGTLRTELKAMGKTIFKDAGDEFVEESLNQVLDKAISVGVLGDTLKVGDLLEESLYAGALGALAGGGIPQLRSGGPTHTQTTEQLEARANAATAQLATGGATGPDGKPVSTDAPVLPPPAGFAPTDNTTAGETRRAEIAAVPDTVLPNKPDAKPTEEPAAKVTPSAPAAASSAPAASEGLPPVQRPVEAPAAAEPAVKPKVKAPGVEIPQPAARKAGKAAAQERPATSTPEVDGKSLTPTPESGKAADVPSDPAPKKDLVSASEKTSLSRGQIPTGWKAEGQTLAPEERKLVDRWDELHYKMTQSRWSKGKKLTKAEEREMASLKDKVRPLILETVDPVNDKTVGKDIHGTPIRASKNGTYYTVENGRVRTGPAFSEETPTPKVESSDLTENPDGSFVLEGRKGRQVQIGGSTRWQVQTEENRQKEAKGERQIGGDRLFDSREEAIAETQAEVLRDRKNAESRSKADAEKTAAEAKEAERLKPLAGFTSGMTPMQRGKAEKTLRKPWFKRSAATGKDYKGEAFSVIRDMVADGYTPVEDEGTYRLERGEGAGFSVNKSEFAYAQWASADRPAPVPAQLANARLNEGRAIAESVAQDNPLASEAPAVVEPKKLDETAERPPTPAPVKAGDGPAQNTSTPKKVTLPNVDSLSDEDMVAAANTAIQRRKESALGLPELGAYKPDAAAKRFAKDPSRLNAKKVVFDSLKAATQLGIPAEIELPAKAGKPSSRDFGVSAESAKTPMMSQYLGMRRALPDDVILLYRLGDFYEVFGDDAKTAAPLMEVALTKRNGTPMAGVPFHAQKSYIAKLLKAGYRVALAEQTADAKPGKLVEREIAEVLSPPTTLTNARLNEGRAIAESVTKGNPLASEAAVNAVTDQLREDPASPDALLRTVAKRAASRRGVRKGEREARAAGNVGTLDTGMQEADKSAAPDEQAARKEESRQVTAAIGQLKGLERAAVEGRRAGKTSQEIADEVRARNPAAKTTAGSVDGAYRTALVKLRELLKLPSGPPVKPHVNTAPPVSPKTDEELFEETIQRLMDHHKVGREKLAELKLAKPTTAAQKSARAIGEFFGRRVIFVSGLKPNGLLDPRNPGTIVLSAKAKRSDVLVVFHELLHSLAATDPKAYRKLQETVKVDLDAYAAQYPTRQGRDLNEEFLADFMADRATDPEFWEGLAKKDRSLFDKLVDLFRGILASVTAGRMGTEGFVKNLKEADLALKDALNVLRLQGELKGLDGGVKFEFAGERANVPQFMRDSLDTAKAMAAAGMPSAEIRAVTGWFPGKYDGKMRWEIPDAGAKLTSAWADLEASSAFGAKPSIRLDAAIDHPELFAAYPELADVVVSKQRGFFDIFGAMQGWFNPDTNTLNVTPNAKEPLSTMLHEIQHWIQTKEGFAKGSNPEAAMKGLSPAQKQKTADQMQAKAQELIAREEKNVTSAEEILTTLRNANAVEFDFLVEAKNKAQEEFLGTQKTFGAAHPQSQSTYKVLREAEKNLLSSVGIDNPLTNWDVAYPIKTATSFDKLQSDTLKKRDKAREAIVNHNNLLASMLDSDEQFEKAVKAFNLSYELYKNVAGEIEARDVQARANMTPEQLKAVEPYSSENIAPESAVVLSDIKFEQSEGEKATYEDWVTSTPYGPADRMVVVYRTAPEGGDPSIRPGTWVSANEAYLEDYAGADWRSRPFETLEVPASDLRDAQTGGRAGDTLIYTPAGIKFEQPEGKRRKVRTAGTDNLFEDAPPSVTALVKAAVAQSFNWETVPLTPDGVRKAIIFLIKLTNPDFLKELQQRAEKAGVPATRSNLVAGAGRGAVVAYISRLAATDYKAAETLLHKLYRLSSDLQTLVDNGSVSASEAGAILASNRSYPGGGILNLFGAVATGRREFIQKKADKKVVEAAQAITAADVKGQASEDLADTIVAALDPAEAARIAEAEVAARKAWDRTIGLLRKIRDIRSAGVKFELPEGETFDSLFDRLLSYEGNKDVSLEEIAALFDTLSPLFEGELGITEAASEAVKKTRKAAKAREKATGTTATTNQADILGKRRIGLVTRATNEDTEAQEQLKDGFKKLMAAGIQNQSDFVDAYVKLGGTEDVGADLFYANRTLVERQQDKQIDTELRQAQAAAERAARNAEERYEGAIDKAQEFVDKWGDKVEPKRPTDTNDTPAKTLNRFVNTPVTEDQLAGQLAEFRNKDGQPTFTAEQVGVLVTKAAWAKEAKTETKSEAKRESAEKQIADREVRAKQQRQVAIDKAQEFVDKIGDKAEPKRPTSVNNTPSKTVSRYMNTKKARIPLEAFEQQLRDFVNKDGQPTFTEDQVQEISARAEIARQDRASLDELKAQDRAEAAIAKRDVADLAKAANLVSGGGSRPTTSKRSIRDIILQDYINNPERKIRTQAERIELAGDILREEMPWITDAERPGIAAMMEGQLALKLEEAKFKAAQPFLKNLGTGKTMTADQVGKAIRLEILDPSKDFITSVAALYGWEGLSPKETMQLTELQRQSDIAGPGSEIANQNLLKQAKLIKASLGIPPRWVEWVNAYIRASVFSGTGSFIIGHTVGGYLSTATFAVETVATLKRGVKQPAADTLAEMEVLTRQWITNYARGKDAWVQAIKSGRSYVSQRQAGQESDIKDNKVFIDPLTQSFINHQKALSKAVAALETETNPAKRAGLRSKQLLHAFVAYVASAPRFTFHMVTAPDAGFLKQIASAQAAIMEYRGARDAGLTKQQFDEISAEAYRIAQAHAEYLKAELGLVEGSRALRIETRDAVEGAITSALMNRGVDVEGYHAAAIADVQAKMGTGATSGSFIGRMTDLVVGALHTSEKGVVPLAGFGLAIRTGFNALDEYTWLAPGANLFRIFKYDGQSKFRVRLKSLEETQEAFPQIRQQWQLDRRRTQAAVGYLAFASVVPLLLASWDQDDEDKMFWFTGKAPKFGSPEYEKWERNRWTANTLVVGNARLKLDRGLAQALWPIMIASKMLAESIKNGVSEKQLAEQAGYLAETFVPGVSHGIQVSKDYTRPTEGGGQAGPWGLLKKQVNLLVPGALKTVRKFQPRIDSYQSEADLTALNPAYADINANGVIQTTNVLGEPLAVDAQPFGWLEKIGMPVFLRVEGNRDPRKAAILKDFSTNNYGGGDYSVKDFKKRLEGTGTEFSFGLFKQWREARYNYFIDRYDLQPDEDGYAGKAGVLWRQGTERADRALGIRKK